MAVRKKDKSPHEAPQERARERAAAFAVEIVKVCKKYGVMISPSDLDCEAADVCFYEHSKSEQFTFSLNLETIEAAVRAVVWQHVYGKNG